MIITRTPLRLSLGGGGTDLPSYYREFGGFVISAAINKYVYVTVNRSFYPGYILKYSELEKAKTKDEIRHKLIREVMNIYDVPDPIEIVSIADVPAGTGLGSSGAFLVGLIHATHAFKRQPVAAEALARQAVDIEMVRLQEPVGKQDQYIAAYGGLLCQEYLPDDTVSVYPLNMSEMAIHELRDSLALYYVGSTRSASAILSDQKEKTEKRDEKMLAGLKFIKELGMEIRNVLEAGSVFEFGELMHQHWESKRKRSSSICNSHIDDLYELGRAKGGAIGGKLVGAGGGGFILFQTKDRSRLRRVMVEHGVSEIDFSFDFDGSIVLTRS